MAGTRTVVLPCLVVLLTQTNPAVAETAESPFSATASHKETDRLVADASGTPGARSRFDATVAEQADPGTRTVLAEVPDIESQLTLDEAIQLALRNNLDIEIARTAPAVAETAIRQAEGAFDPVGTARYIFDHGEEPIASFLNPNNTRVSSDGWDYGGGIGGILPFGLRYSMNTGVNRIETDRAISALDRQFTARWNNEITMPLMRDFRDNQANVTLRRSRMSRDMSEDEFRVQLSGIVASVEDRYWDLAAKRAAVNVAQKSLKTAEDLLQQTIVQEEVGVVSRVAVTQARAGVAERDLNLIRAENARDNAHDLLLDTLLAPSAAVFEDRELIPEPPRFEDYPVDLAVSIQRALKNRPEIAMQEKAVEMAKLEVKLADNQAKPRLDLVGSFGLAGLSGRQTDAVMTPLDLPESGIDSFDDFFNASGEKSYRMGLEVEVPFFNRTGKGSAAQRRIEERRARTRVRLQEQLVVREVRQAVRGIESAAKSVRAAERRRAASLESLRAEQERLRLGDSTPFQVLEFDADLSEAEGQVIDALRSYENAITELERVQGTLLQKRRIEIDDELNR